MNIRKKKEEIGHGVYYPLPLHLQPAYKHLGYKKGDFPEPFELNQGYGVFRILDKQTGSGEKFTDELKTKYVQELQSKLRYEKFLTWSVELIQKAKLKDYMPQSEPPAAGS